MRLAHLALVVTILGVGVGGGAIGTTPCFAQTPATSLEEVRRQLAAGDFIRVIPAGGQPIAGRLVRFGDVDLQVEARQGGAGVVTIPLDTIQSLERPRDPARNGALMGAGVGAGAGGALFVYALAIDRNDLDEWGPSYLAAAAIFTGIGALVGWAVDAANAKPHLRFDAPGRRTTVRVGPLYSPRGGLGFAVSVSR